MSSGLDLKSNSRKSRILSYARDEVKPKVFSSFPPACLPEQDEDLPVGSECMIIGWGKKKSTNIFGTDVLNEAEVNIDPSMNFLKIEFWVLKIEYRFKSLIMISS